MDKTKHRKTDTSPETRRKQQAIQQLIEAKFDKDAQVKYGHGPRNSMNQKDHTPGSIKITSTDHRNANSPAAWATLVDYTELLNLFGDMPKSRDNIYKLLLIMKDLNYLLNYKRQAEERLAALYR